MNFMPHWCSETSKFESIEKANRKVMRALVEMSLSEMSQEFHFNF